MMIPTDAHGRRLRSSSNTKNGPLLTLWRRFGIIGMAGTFMALVMLLRAVLFPLSSSPSMTNINKKCHTTGPVTYRLDSGGGTPFGSGNCSFTFPSSSMTTTTTTTNNNNNNNNNVQAKVEKAITDWKYDGKVQKFMPEFEKKRILDVGMGQGPWGAALLRAGVQYYVGMDPDVCPPIHARTRDPSFPRKGATRQCMKAYNITDEKDPVIDECTGGDKKYRSFDVTGVEMMEAYPGKLALLPGTFESLSDKLKMITFDYVMLNTVTEHLQFLQPVFRGLYDVMDDCSSTADIIIDHHNYYGFSGHHGFPKDASEAEQASKSNPELMELADWGHLEPDASQALNPSLNRVRPGDLQTLLNVYFDCTCSRTTVPEKEMGRLTNERKQVLKNRGFQDIELSTNHVKFRCKRKTQRIKESVLKSLIFHHPPMDGSYKPHKFICS